MKPIGTKQEINQKKTDSEAKYYISNPTRKETIVLYLRKNKIVIVFNLEL